MSGSIPNVLIILLAIATHGSLAFLIMRFALRASRGPEVSYHDRASPRGPGGASPSVGTRQP